MYTSPATPSGASSTSTAASSTAFTSVPASTRTSHMLTMSAALSSLNLLSPQRFNTPIAVRGSLDRSSGTATKALIPSVEITIGTDPQVLVRRAVNTVAAGPLRNFLRSVLAERDVNRVLTLLPEQGFKFQRLPIDRLRSAALTASLQSLQGPRARDTLYAAVLIAGIESLLGDTVEPPYSSTDVMRSVVRNAMRSLDAADSSQAHALRGCLGWGNEDEHFHARSQSLQNQVVSAVQKLRNQQILSRHGQAM